MARTMKPSGIEWLGEIPADWEVVNIRKFFSFGKGLSITKEDLRESGISVVSYGQIHSKFNNGTALTPELIRFVDDDYLQSSPQSLVKRGDFIFADTSEDLDGCGNCVYVDIDDLIFAGYHTIILRNKTCADLKYCAFLFQSDAWRKQIRERVMGVKLFSISQKILRATNILLPPLDEQQRIAAFLDDKCARIDSVVEKTRASIEEYRKLKQAIITRAVTRGIRPNRTLKHSGIEWLGDIPDDWELVSIGRLFNISAGGDAKPEYYSDTQDEEHPYPVYTNSMNKNQVYAYTSKPIYLANTITVTGRGAIGTAFYRNTPYDAIIRLLSLSPKIDLDCRFYAYWISNVIHFFTDSAAIGQLSAVQMSSYKTAYCSKNEQREIAAYLDEKTSAIDSLVAKKNQLVAELERLKKSLIFEYVTGKKEVAQ